MNGSKTTRPTNTKPVNINISFTINPKNILNQQSFGIENHLKNKKITNALQAQSIQKQSTHSKPKTPELINTQRVDLNREFMYRQDDKKEKKSRKRNSVDQCYLNDWNKKSDGQKSINIIREAESLHARKSSTKSKKQSQSSAKQKHNKTISKISAVDNFKVRQQQSAGNNLFMEQKTKNIKSIINRLITNQLSKKSLPLQLPTQQNRTARKKKVNRKKQLKQGFSQNLFRRNQKQQDIDAINRKMILQKLTSLRSMNNSIFHSENDEQIKPRQRRTIIINTDHSIDCINQIHQMEKAASKLYRQNIENGQRQRATQTKNLIDQYIAILNQNMLQSEGTQANSMPIEAQFENYRNQHVHHDLQSSRNRSQRYQVPQRYQQPRQLRQNQEQKQKQKQKQRQKEREKNHLRQFCSSQMTKQQKMINQIQRIKLNQLKKHEVQKWGELLTFIKKSMSEGKANHDQILLNIYHFLQQTKIDLQKQISKDPEQPQKDKLEEFTNKFQNHQAQQNKKSQQQSIREENQNEFNEISSMSYQDQNYQEQNQELKLMNLEMIQNALKSRHESLLEKRDRQIYNLEQQKNMGKITQANFLTQKQKLQKWTKKQTSQIMQARKNIWKGYNQAKGIIQKSLKSKYFQQQSAKKKSMMKCLSQNYLLKNYNYKKLLKAEQQDQSQQQQQSIQVRQTDRSNKKEKSQISKNKETIQKYQKFNQDQLQDSQNSQRPEQQSEEPQSDNEKDRQQDHDDSYQFHGQQSRSIQNQIINQKPHSYANNQLRDLREEDDMNVIKQKLLDIKQKHLAQDSPENSDEKVNSRDEISYQQVDNQLQQSISDNQIKLINQELGKQANLPPSAPAPDFDYDRLKHILPQDKEDIFQFIFLDLSIQLYQEPCHDNRIMEAINKYVSYMKRQANKKKGVKTNLNVVKQYLKRFLGYVLRAHRDVLKTLDQPVGPTAIQMLRYMHENDEEPIDGEQAPSPLVIPTTIFDSFEKSFLPSIEFQPYYEHDEERQNKRIQFLKNILHIHNKALFDAMNEYLDLLRPFGIWGKPFPWKRSSAFQRICPQQQKQQKLKKSSDKVIQFCSYVCGLLVDKQQSLVGNARLSQDYIQQIKQDRLSRMLATQLMQNQQRWLFYDDQQTQVLVQISNAVYLMMVRQATHQAYQILKKRKDMQGDASL